MRIRTLAILVVLFVSVPLFANETKIYSSYESVRQALLKNAVPDVQKSAAALAAAARSEKQDAVAARATALAGATSVASARKAFAALSDEVIKFRDAQSGDKPSVAYCSMEKKSWLQPKGAIANPYVDAGMRGCGEFKR